MKKILIINLFLLLILYSFLGTVNAVTIDETLLETNIGKLNSMLETSIDTTNPNYLTEIIDENGNVPAYKYYPNHIPSRSIKALQAYDGKIFMGLGDWNDNTGPVKILYYDTVDGQIKSSGTINDEAVQSFDIIDGQLYTTGCDPRDPWGYGSYYIYNKDENKWDQHLKNNGWVHVFHMTKFKDKIFMSGETTGSVYSHIQYTQDNGETFINTKIFNEGKDLSHYTDLRCYNMFCYNEKLYAYLKLQSGSNTYRRYLFV